MLEAAALAEPEERAVLQPDRIAVLVHPRLRRLAQHACARDRSTRRPDSGRAMSARDPGPDARPAANRESSPTSTIRNSLAAVRAEIDPRRAAARDARDARASRSDSDRRLSDSRSLRVPGDTECDRRRCTRGPAARRAGGTRVRRRVGTPPVALELSAPVDLLLVEPVELSVEQSRGCRRSSAPARAATRCRRRRDCCRARTPPVAHRG